MLQGLQLFDHVVGRGQYLGRNSPAHGFLGPSSSLENRLSPVLCRGRVKMEMCV